MVQVPVQALSSDLPAGAKVVLTVLWMHARKDTRFVWPSKELLCTECGTSRRTLLRNLSVLRKSRWITEGVGENGCPGWNLCDPPGTPVFEGIEGAVGTHDRPPAPVNIDANRDNIGIDPVRNDRSEMSDRSKMARRSVKNGAPLLIGTLHKNKEPGSGYTVQGKRENAPPASPVQIDAATFRMEYMGEWRARFGGLSPSSGHRVDDPTAGAVRQDALEAQIAAHSAEVVAAVLFHAGDQVARWHDTRGAQGLDPKFLGAVFMPGRERAWGAALDRWQAAKGLRRHSGKIAAAPADIDGVQTTDEEAREYMRCGGGIDGTRAVRDMRLVEQSNAATLQFGDLFGVEGVS